MTRIKRQKLFRFMRQRTWIRWTRRALGDFGDGPLGDFEFGIRRANGKSLFFDTNDHGNDTAIGYNFVSWPDGFEESFLLFGLLLLRPQQDKIEHKEHDGNHAEAPECLSARISF